jgi:hypothetical protein
MGEWKYSYTIPDFGTRWRLLVSFTLMPLYFLGEFPLSTQWIWAGRFPEPVWKLYRKENLSLCRESNSGYPSRSPLLRKLSSSSSCAGNILN